MAKFAFFAAILLVLGAVQLAQAEDVPQDFAPLDPTEGSGFVNTTLEESIVLHFYKMFVVDAEFLPATRSS
ncbi:hypothetical protein PR002_g12319 [Phytophthora rubi]|uniref:RxLR effector protein n=1 Tax=Phytophthora rubi TaxID=129364 RepID=A0A6A3LPI6_9STRA|nr:hypothetical protein PR002_g12319 [Phytophthora rubi]